ncbi:carbamoyl-phosphate synthase large subunit [Qipengyuania atrilutea]|uniref:Carbamoyl phosphate synthase large chain n=1 Tax=Qipengyuania atrilutea TaxID=2744473 RepID=A0A850GW39_9SPHN|nr:carbamoyl-phosphate synthase large subunit [Actirhodobacter atriluteus]NVD43741.1 carbamoyl-phosphate synthase large subunit [Actirhodobacter atriluteus]
MPKRNDISSILVIGAGPIIIGQACEFDYSGTQAIKALREEGYRVILVNSNPATIMTDPDMADATYVEPITPEIVAKIIAKEKPDALLPTMGGQTALNCALKLDEMGVLAELGVEMIGAKADAIDKAENRNRFREAMDSIGLESARSGTAHTVDEAFAVLERTGLPAIIRPSFTLGGTGGGIAYNRSEFENIVRSGLEASPTTEVLIEESLLGWKEYEMEVVRDRNDNCIIVCSIENVDPMGVHTGDSITVAPALTLTDKEYQIMRTASLNVLREIGVETGGSNVQFAVNPEDGRLIVIEMNPRVSRSSALASKATGFPIARIAAKLAVGYTLDELTNEITGATPASFEPTIDYVVTKIPRFAFEKFRGAEATLSTAMKSVGEVMAIGRSFAESMQKALRGLETGLDGFNRLPELEGVSRDVITAALAKRTPQRILQVAQAFREGLTVEEIHAVTAYDPWFLRQIEAIIYEERMIAHDGLPNDAEELRRLKAMGFSDKRLSTLAVRSVGVAGGLAETQAKRSGLLHDTLRAMAGATSEEEVRALRHKLGVFPVFKRIDSCAAEFEAITPYMYSTYEAPTFGEGPDSLGDEARPSDRRKIVILGGGPNRIGQGIEFDYCCVHACYALGDAEKGGAGFETIMVNCNPETVSTDYDTSDRLYFEPLTAEDVLEILRVEQQSGEVVGVIVQFGGQTPLKLAAALEAEGIPILGTSPDAIDLAEDRERFAKLVNQLGLKQPSNGIARSRDEAAAVARQIGYPVLLRPSYVLGGRAMEIVESEAQLDNYIATAVNVSGDSPVLIDQFLRDAIECDVDVVSDGKTVRVAGVMQHIEEAGVHSGDSACTLPPYSLSQDVIAEMERQAEALADALSVVGLMNVQFAVKDGEVYLIEVNPRASRTVPFVAKATGAPIAAIAARVMAGEPLDNFEPFDLNPPHMAVKEAVFPFARFPGSDPVLTPEMKSTGEVMGIDSDFPTAFLKSQLGAGVTLPREGTLFVSVKDSDKSIILPAVRTLIDQGFKVVATGGTQTFLAEQGLPVERVNKVAEGRPHIVDAIIDGEIALIFNTTEGWQSLLDSASIRASALDRKVPYYTTAAASLATADAIRSVSPGDLEVKSLQAYYS